MKILKRNKVSISFLVITSLLLFSSFNIVFALGASLKSQGVTVNLQKEDPLSYVALVPSPGTYTTFSVDGSNQGTFKVMDWNQNPEGTPLVINDPGNDISLTSYPEYLNYKMETESSNNYVNPWNARWLNMSAYNAEADKLDPFTFSSVYDYYTMGESQQLSIQLSQGIPLQVDLKIGSAGPKVLKVDWLLPNPNENPMDNYFLRDPNGKQLYTYYGAARDSSSTIIFRYILFVASKPGTYRLLIDASPSIYPSNVILDFLNSEKFNVPIGGVVIGGSGGDFPTTDDMNNQKWSTEWFIISGSAGQKVEINIGTDYDLGGTYNINFFVASINDNYGEYTGISSIANLADIYPFIFSKTGKVYFSISGLNLYRLSMTVRKIDSTSYKIGNDLTIKTLANTPEGIQFSTSRDNFIRFNFTSLGLGDPDIGPGIFGTNKMFVYSNSKNLNFMHLIAPGQQVADNGIDYYYYYMPAGTYHAVIINSVNNENGVFKISSRIVDHNSEGIPITELTYPESYPKDVNMAEFKSFDDNSQLKQAQWFDINIKDTGQYRFNLTMLADDYSPLLANSADPSYVLTYNVTSGEYTDVTSKSLTEGQSFPAMENVGDELLIAFPEKWHDIDFNISQLGSGGSWYPYASVWTGNSWENLNIASDDTNELRSANGSVVLDLNDAQFKSWRRGCDFNISYISNESNYYWLNISCDNNYNIDVPYIDLIELSNISIIGDFNFYLIGKSGYVYSDFWEPTTQLTNIQNIILNQESSHLTYSTEGWLVTTSDPNIVGLKEGPYKLLVIPNHWSIAGDVKLRLSIENYWNYRVQESYDITSQPELHEFQINNYTDDSYGFTNGTFYNYTLSKTYNHTEASLGISSDESYFAIECTGKKYAWTQLVVAMYNVSNYELYLLQDLPWVTGSGPNNEERLIGNTISTNSTFEFGVPSDKFILLFEVENAGELITFKIALSQYETSILNIRSPQISTPINWPLILIIVGVSVGVAAALGVNFKSLKRQPN
ncbi:MAG: hypothetical protein P8Y97_00960 [Candidatus Lokiarchaeota archaeon]